VAEIPEDWRTRLHAWASREPLVIELFVFGSRVKGTSRPDSDLDVAIRVAGETPGVALANAIFETARWQRALQSLLPVPVDLQSMFDDDQVVAPAVREHGQCVYRSLSERARIPRS
jgi:predicted nucleotidyltransferase